jgi:uncharacterized protein YegP (UPF0339 family)
MANEPRFEVYPRQRSEPVYVDDPEGARRDVPTGDFGWRFRAANGKITAIGGEGFTRREDARCAVIDFRESVVSGGKRIAWPTIIAVDE